MRFKSTGILRYYENPEKLILSIHQGIADYYYSLIPLYTRPYPSPQKFMAHISVVRNQHPKVASAWKKHEGRRVEFEYDPYVHNDNTYYWLNAWSHELEAIRIELGLAVADAYTRSPDGSHRFHITIGNTKTTEVIERKKQRRLKREKPVVEAEPIRSRPIIVEVVYTPRRSR